MSLRSSIVHIETGADGFPNLQLRDCAHLDDVIRLVNLESSRWTDAVRTARKWAGAFFGDDGDLWCDLKMLIEDIDLYWTGILVSIQSHDALCSWCRLQYIALHILEAYSSRVRQRRAQQCSPTLAEHGKSRAGFLEKYRSVSPVRSSCNGAPHGPFHLPQSPEHEVERFLPIFFPRLAPGVVSALTWEPNLWISSDDCPHVEPLNH